jgi:hypothetical protein
VKDCEVFRNMNTHTHTHTHTHIHTYIYIHLVKADMGYRPRIQNWLLRRLLLSWFGVKVSMLHFSDSAAKMTTFFLRRQLTLKEQIYRCRQDTDEDICTTMDNNKHYQLLLIREWYQSCRVSFSVADVIINNSNNSSWHSKRYWRYGWLSNEEKNVGF